MKSLLPLALMGALTGCGSSTATFDSTASDSLIGDGSPNGNPVNVYSPGITCGAVTTLAGSTSIGSANGSGTAASFDAPGSAAADSAGNVYVADTMNNMIRRIAPGGAVSTLAGATTAGSANGTGTAASFNNPYGITVSPFNGDIYVADSLNHMIRQITPGGVVSTFAGSTTAGFADGTGTAASFDFPAGIAADASGNLYVADTANNEVRMITSAGVVTTLAGSPAAGFADGTGSLALFFNPYGIALDSSANIYVADTLNNRIRMVTQSGVVTTLAGSVVAGTTNGMGIAASFNEPRGITLDRSANIYVADTGNNEIREITPSGAVSSIAGATAAGSANGTGSAAAFDSPGGIVFAASEMLFVADSTDNMIREIQSGSGCGN